MTNDDLKLIQYNFDNFNYSLQKLKEFRGTKRDLLCEIMIKVAGMGLSSFGEPDKNVLEKDEFMKDCIDYLVKIRKYQVEPYI